MIRWRLPLVLLATASALALTSCDEGDTGPDMGQGWSAEDRLNWYSATQGSRLMPKAWFDALEQVGTTDKFKTTANLAQFGFLTSDVETATGLPIGFAVDRQDDSAFKTSGIHWYEGQQSAADVAEPWIGLNCSACHTTQIVVDGETLTIDGGANLLDFQLFIEELDKALKATAADEAKFARFSAEVLGDRDTEANRTLLRASFDTLLAWQEKTDVMNETPMRYGYGRLDAVGHILNKVLMFNGADASAGNPANAPVSYPFLWNIWKQKQVQWNGVAENSRLEIVGDPIEYGALGRNTGEVLGVFGEVIVTPPGDGALSKFEGYTSSVQIGSLDSLEALLKRLEPPAWPESLPAPDADMVSAGEALFRDKCSSCHLMPEQQVEGEKTERMITFEAVLKSNPENLTDIWMACNAWSYTGPTGPLKGVEDENGEPMGDTAPVANMLAVQVKGALMGQKAALIGVAVRNFLTIKRPPVVFETVETDPREAARSACLDATNQPLLAYKARPLDGIWATAPYLHNGSVASLYELLLPADQRMTEFWVGNRNFDPVNVGYETTDPGDGLGFLFRTRDDAGKVIEGNSNAGHEYGARGFSPEDRQALVAYMSTL